MKPLLKPSSRSTSYHATMRSPSFWLLSRNQITRLNLRERLHLSPTNLVFSLIVCNHNCLHSFLTAAALPTSFWFLR